MAFTSSFCMLQALSICFQLFVQTIYFTILQHCHMISVSVEFKLSKTLEESKQVVILRTSPFCSFPVERFFAYFQQHPHLQASVSFQPASLWGNMQHQSLRAGIPASFHQLETLLAVEVFQQLETLLAFEVFPSSSHRLLGE
ncbi:hypothetical protein H5410_018567, partial [Solanum commersonii]